jgi:glycosyltransferase involved in cell wall biosynthesis
VEEFVDSARELLEQQGWEVRILACRLDGGETSAHAVVPTRLVGGSGWPLPTGGWRTVWDEVVATDVVIANNARHPLSVLAVIAASIARRPALLVIHGSGQGRYAGERLPGLVRELFQRTLGRLAVRLAMPVSVSRVGVRGTRELYGVETGYLPYPLRDLPPASPRLAPSPAEPFRVVWVGRLSPEKGPLLAVRAVEALRRRTDSQLSMYGDGPLRAELDALARERPWLSVLGSRPWPEVLHAQENAHACLSTSVADNVQVALLEALSRGVPAVSTRVGDAPLYYATTLARFCVDPGDAGQLATALGALAASYDSHRQEFANNAASLRRRHARAASELAALVQAAVARGGSRR